MNVARYTKNEARSAHTKGTRTRIPRGTLHDPMIHAHEAHDTRTWSTLKRECYTFQEVYDKKNHQYPMCTSEIGRLKYHHGGFIFVYFVNATENYTCLGT